MGRKWDVKITVMKRLFNEDMARDYTTREWKRCDRVKDGQEFISEGGGEMPPGFCGPAWVDIMRYSLALGRGADFVGTTPGVFVTCCTDGYRPVIFKIERVDDRDA